MDSNYQVVECESNEPSWEYTVRNKTRGIAAERKAVQKAGHSMASKLKPGVFVAVQDREDGNHAVPFMIGMTIDTGDGACFAVPAKGRQYVNRTRYDDGEYGVAVQWLSRLAEDPEQRTFELDKSSEQFIFNSTELRCIDIEMPRMCAGPTPRRPTTRRKGRGVV